MWTLFVFSTVALAGCLGGNVDPADAEPVKDPDWAVRAIFLDADPAATDHIPDHDHNDPSIHKGLSTPNFQVIGHDGMESPYYSAQAGSFYCGGVSETNGERRLAVGVSVRTDTALLIMDVTDSTEPYLIGELVVPLAVSYDADIFEDGRYAAMVLSPDAGEVLSQVPDPGAADPVPFTATFRNACTGEESEVESQVDETPYGYSTVLVDLEDPTRPVIVDAFQDQSRNMHSVSVLEVDGTRYIASASLQRAVQCIPGYDAPVPQPCAEQPQYGDLMSHYNFFTVEEGPTGATLSLLATYSRLDAGNAGSLSNEDLSRNNYHVDVTLEQHPITGDLIAYMAHWDGGFIVARIDGPMQVTHLADWGEEDDARWGEDHFGNAHSVVTLGELYGDGRSFVLFGQESENRPTYRPTGQVVLMETTDPAVPTPVARWTLPVDVQWSSCCPFSLHYPVVQDGFLFVSAYHAGVWAVDMRPEKWPELPSIGVFMPDRDIETEPITQGDAYPEVLEVLQLGDNKLLVYDANTGAYTVEFTGFHEDVPPTEPWTADAWIGRY